MLQRLHFLAVTLVALIFAACQSTKYVDDGDYLLERVGVRGDYGTVSADELHDYIRQIPNSRVLGFWRLNLGIYNLSRPRDKAFSNWLRRIGEAPVVMDSALTKRSAEQLRLYMSNHGYFNARVKDSVIITDAKKCRVQYHVTSGDEFRIGRISYSIADSTLGAIVMADTANTLIRSGELFNVETHDLERLRIMRLLQEHGYWAFGKDYVYFMADSNRVHGVVDDQLVILNRLGDSGLGKMQAHKQSVIGRVTYSSPKSELFNSKIIDQRCYLHTGSIFKASDVELTQRNLHALALFGMVNVKMEQTTDSALIDSIARVSNFSTSQLNDSLHEVLNCNITLTTNKLQSYNVELEGTNSSGNLGAAAAFGYKHLNIFRKAETFDLKYRIATQNQFARDGKERFFTFETGVEASVSVPKFLFPVISTLQFNRRCTPITRFAISYDYQRRPDFTKSVLSTNFSYAWTSSPIVRHMLTPVEFSSVKVPRISDDFWTYISGSYLEYSYQSHLIMSVNYTYTLNQQLQKLRADRGWYVRFSAETAGNFLSAVAHAVDDDGTRTLWNVPYAQYVKADAEVRYKMADFWNNKIVGRVYLGAGLPYGNSQALPFEKSYFVGGANSIRAWPVRGLGPGSCTSTKQRYSNQTSDIRIEANAEYRFKVVSILEGAIFADAGNIWAWPHLSEDPDGALGKDFYRQIAVGSGLGLRFNFDYFVLRFDAAVKLHDPSAELGSRWVIATQRFHAPEIYFNFAIGYPF